MTEPVKVSKSRLVAWAAGLIPSDVGDRSSEDVADAAYAYLTRTDLDMWGRHLSVYAQAAMGCELPDGHPMRLSKDDAKSWLMMWRESAKWRGAPCPSPRSIARLIIANGERFLAS